MKKLYSVFVLFTLLFCYTGNVWGETLTVANGTTYQNGRYVPLYGNYDDAYQRVQILYPSSLLSDMNGKEISSMTFYLKTKATKVYTSTYNIRLVEVDNTSVPTSYISTTGVATSYSGTLDARGETMTITFSSPFSYSGGNLLFDLQSTPLNSSGYSDSYFYGVNQDANLSTAANSNSSLPTSGTARYFLPKTTFTYDAPANPNCADVTGLTKGDVTSTTAEFSWTTASVEEWQYVCLPKASTVNWEDAAVQATTSNSASISDLSGSTEYKFYVRANCGSINGNSRASVLEFKTPCGAKSIPYHYGFEDVTYSSGTYVMPECWEAYPSGGNYPSIYGYNAKRGSNSLVIKGSSAAMAIAPQLATPLNLLTVSFYYYNIYQQSSSGQLELGYITDGDPTTFTRIGDAFAKLSSYASDSTEVTLSSVPAAATNLAFRYTGSSYSSYDGIYLDEIHVAVAASCAKPTSLTAAASSATSINLSWTKGGDETKWNAQYRVGSGEWTAVNDISTTVSGTTCTATLTGLSEKTTYEVQVQADCGGEQSGWSNSATEKTPCMAQTAIGFEEDFESTQAGYTPSYDTYKNMPDCWDAISSDEYVYVRSSGGKTGQCLYMYGSSSAHQTALLPVFTEDLNTITVSFYYKNYNTSTSYGQLKVGYYYNGTFTSLDDLARRDSYDSKPYSLALSTVPSGARIAFVIDNGTYKNEAYIDDVTLTKTPSCFAPTSVTRTALTYNSATFEWAASGHGETQYQYACVAKNASPSSWTLLDEDEREVTISNLTTDNEYDFYVRSYCGASDQSDAAEKITFQPTCQVPTGVAASAVTSNSASIGWTANNGESMWNLQYKKGSGSWNTVSNITANPYTLNNLDANSDYTVQVACAEGCNSGYSSTATFHTKCPSSTITKNEPFEETFTSSSWPSCWEKSEGDYPAISGGSVYFYGSSEQMITLPSFTNDIETLTISFDHKNYYGTSYAGTIQVGYIKSDGTFVSRKSSTPGTSYEEFSQVITKANASDVVLNYAIKYTATYSYARVYIDNVVVKITPTCFVPASIADATIITSDGATLSWTASGKGETTYQWAVAEGSAAPSWVDDEAHKVSNATSKVLTDLEANTAYTFYVRSYCGADDQSEAVSKAFTTSCGKESLPFEYGFEDATNVYMPSCWKAHYASGYYAYAYTNNPHTGSKSLNACAPKTSGSETVVVLPEIDAALNKLGVTFFYKGTAGASIEVGYVTNPDNKTTFVKVGDAITVAASYKEAFVSFESLGSVSGNVALRFKGASGDAYFYIDDIRVARTVTLADNTDNSSLISSLAAAGETVDVLLSRSLLMDGDYNPLCLPFSLSAAQLADEDCPLNNFKLKVFDYTQEVGDELHLYIAGASSIEAGVPYFVSYQGSPEATKSQHLFRDVKITTTTTGTKTYEKVTYQGTFAPTTLTDQSGKSENPEILFLGADNTIYYPNTNVNLKGFRAYFTVDYSIGAPARPIRRICFGEQGENTATGIEDTDNAQTTRKRVENNQVIIIRDGVKYTVLGQKIQ